MPGGRAEPQRPQGDITRVEYRISGGLSKLWSWELASSWEREALADSVVQTEVQSALS